jgi:MSHA biogenesis protein MshJ
LTADADAAEEAVKTLQKGLVSPYQIEQVLEGVIDRQRGLRLIALRKLPLESVAVSKPAPQAPSDAKPAPAGGAAQASATAGGATPASAPSRSESIYKHGVQIVVEGQYFDMLNYLAALEKLPYQVFWGNARLEVRDYPNAKLTLDVFTLSLEKKWLSI